ncbi:MAG: VWA domain-containing protein [Gammaproteobacteria bacterium]|nr:VWA domain-containing protein [Gammaproteobacteria bacterium]
MTHKNKVTALPVIPLLVNLLLPTAAEAAGLLTPADGQTPALEIKTQAVDVVLEDGYATTKVEQVFHNPNGRDLEAVYSFPVPQHGAVAEFTVWIDGKPVTGEVLEKQKARQVYEAEKAAGREAGLTEKDEYRTFDIRVSPVRANQDTRIRLVYLQPAHVDTNIGRYVYPLEEGGVDGHKLAFWTANKNVTQQFSFNLRFKSAYPIDALRLPNQPNAVINRKNASEWNVKLESVASTATSVEEGATTPVTQSVAYTLDKDIVVYWRHQAGLPGSVDMVTYKPEGAARGTFMLTVTPGDDLKPVTEGSDWIFVLDTSGSMQGKYATLADGVQRALGNMRANDRFRIVLFSSSAQELTSGYVNATPEMIKYYSNELAKITPNNGTDLFSGLLKGMNSIEDDRTTAIVLVTDGVANVGETQQRKFIDLLKTKDIRLFTFVMGNSANTPLLEAMTRHSNGFALSISNSDDIVGKILEATSKVTHESMHDINVSISGVKTGDMQPKTIGSLYHGQQLTLFGHYWGDGVADVRLTGKVSGTPKEYRTQITFPAAAISNPEVERLWAYAAIESMMEDIHDFGENADTKQAVTDIAMEYGLVTDYTSMVVVRDEVFESLGIQRSNKKRLEVEQIAQQNRAQQAPVSHRVDTQQPMFSSSRAGHGGGGGAMGSWMLLMLVPLLWSAMQRKKQYN